MSTEIPEWLRFSLSEEVEASLRRHLRYPDGGLDEDRNLEGAFSRVKPPISNRISDDSPELSASATYPHSRVRIVAPYEHTHRFRVKPKEEGITLEDLLCARFPFRSRSGWREKIAKGLVLLGGRATSASEVLKQNAEICHRNIGVVEPSVPDDVRILYENERLLLIDKPAPMPVHPGGRYNKNTVISVLAERGYPGLHIVHRLDSVTSGLLIFAKDAKAARIMQELFVGGRVSKRYEAVVRGVPPDDEKVISRGIVRRRGYEFMCSDGEESSAAQTRVWVLERGAGWARVLCEPVTGRTHQIRLHLQDWGYPIWDDPLYGSVQEKSPAPHDSKNSENSSEGFSEIRQIGDSISNAIGKKDFRVTGDPTISETRPGGDSKSNQLGKKDVGVARDRTDSESPSAKPQALQNRSISLINVHLGFH